MLDILLDAVWPKMALYQYMARLLTSRPNLAKLGFVTLRFEYCDICHLQKVIFLQKYVI
jgi:hypothetical protein